MRNAGMLVVGAFLLVWVIVVASTGAQPAAAPVTESLTPTATPTPTPTPTPTEAFPLTGVATDDPRRDQPVVAAKIENTRAAHPQAGLDRADMVYEEIVEAGITRFAALFHSDLPAEVGPIRSGRLIDRPLLDPWNSLFVYSGARGDVTATLQASDSIGLLADPGTGPVFWRAPGRPGSHDLMADLTAALERAENYSEVGPVPDVPYRFDDDPPSDGRDDPTVTIRMTGSSSAGWEWDRDAEVFRRLQNGAPLQVTGEGRIGAANVVAILTDVGAGGCCDTAGNPFTTTRLTGGGAAVVWRDGQRFEATWRKDADRDMLELLDADGEAFVLRPGPTWFHLTRPSAVAALPEPSEPAEDASSGSSEPEDGDAEAIDEGAAAG